MTYAVILAGGVGSRFWPLSRAYEPKQFLNLCSKRPMIEETIHRVSGLINKENIYIATSKIHSQKIKRLVKSYGISAGHILFEPEGKNTLAPIGVLSQRINSIDPGAVIAVLPSDHFIRQRKRFSNLLKKAIEVAKEGYIVTLGVTPKRPETGYGYIKLRAKRKAMGPQKPYYEIESFIEKPSLKKAKGFLKDKRYYWNCGIFIFRADVMLGEIRRFSPQAYKIITQIKNKKSLDKLWPGLLSISVDYAIMEKTKKAALLPADCGWLDLGSWRAIEEVLKRDKCGNIYRGNCVSIADKDTLVWSNKGLVATIGLENIIVVNTEDALLVCRKDLAQEVKKIARLLKENKLK
jgi:mannose-1-phosphate guanylyltransferase